jgi:outer membrane protein assembly factor BamB
MKTARTALLALLVTASASAQMFRGDAAHTAAYPLDSPAHEGRNLAGLQWRFATEGEAISSPVVAGDRVYAGSGDGHLYALDRLTGATIWTFDARSAIHSSPAAENGLVFFATREGTLVAVDATSGKQRWRVATGPDKPLPWGHETGDYYVASPVLAGNGVVLFGAGDGSVRALDEKTGKPVWRTEIDERIRSTPAVAEGLVFVGTAQGRLHALSLKDGARRWTFDTEGTKLDSSKFGYDRRSIQSSPAVANGDVYFGARDGWVYAVGAVDGKQRWRYDHHISWIITSPAVADGVVYDASSDGAFVQALNAADGTERWRTKTGAPLWSSPAISGGVLYIGDHAGFLRAIDRTTGAELWFFRSTGDVLSSPVVSGDLVLFASSDGSIYALHVGRHAAVRRAYFPSEGEEQTVDKMLTNRKYEKLDGPGVAAFLRDRTADRAASVIVFNSDPPTEVIALLPPYLDAGGKVVWTGIPPALWPPDPKSGKRTGLDQLDYEAPGRMFGVDHARALFDKRGVRTTATGQRWGLTGYWRGTWGVSPSAVTEVLGLDEWGLAAAWVKNYGGPEGTGLVRVPGDDPVKLYFAAEYRPAAR